MIGAVMLAILVISLVGLAVALVVALGLPAATQAIERARIERETAEASWRIHQRATAAFAQLLDAARVDTSEDDQ